MRNNVDDSVGSLCTFDWGRTVRYCVFGDPSTSRIVENIQVMVDELCQNYPDIKFAIVCEATFMSYPVGGSALKAHDPFLVAQAERDTAIDYIRRRGHVLFVFETRMTANARRHMGLQSDVPLRGKEKDIADDKAIIHIARSKPLRPVKKSTEYNHVLAEKRRLCARFLNALRFDEAKKDWVRFVESAANLPAVREKKRTETGRELLSEVESSAWDDGNGKYNVTSLAAVTAAAIYAGSQREFDSLIGFHENGTGSLMRSDIMHHRWAIKERKNGAESNSPQLKIARRDYQRSLRIMYRMLRDADIRSIRDRFAEGERI